MLVKYTAESGVHFGEILFWRASLTVPMLGLWLAAQGQLSRLRTNRMPAHIRRAVLGMIGMALTFGAPILLPLAESTTLGFTTPIFAVILSALLLRETVGPWRWGAVIAGFLGILVITQPGQSHMPMFGVIVGLSGAFMVAVISIQLRDLGRTDEPIAIVFWFSAWSTAVFALGLPFFIEAHSPKQWLLLLAIGALGCVAQLLLTASLRFGQVASVIVMDYSSLIWATLYGWMIWNRLPPTTTWLGAPLVIGAGALIAWREHRLSRPGTA
ncbi:DMT family transporter [Qipengyuania soli]|uniref:DMT family transporter n=2 Tax=Qipengyuania soli TaxID=2782568 RepID=A0A7S8F740_9SPHN|nr:DMT family transporter [Qipengyuania soli]